MALLLGIVRLSSATSRASFVVIAMGQLRWGYILGLTANQQRLQRNQLGLDGSGFARMKRLSPRMIKLGTYI
jgi:hypothetical protein